MINLIFTDLKISNFEILIKKIKKYFLRRILICISIKILNLNKNFFFVILKMKKNNKRLQIFLFESDLLKI